MFNNYSNSKKYYSRPTTTPYPSNLYSLDKKTAISPPKKMHLLESKKVEEDALEHPFMRVATKLQPSNISLYTSPKYHMSHMSHTINENTRATFNNVDDINVEKSTILYSPPPQQNNKDAIGGLLYQNDATKNNPSKISSEILLNPKENRAYSESKTANASYPIDTFGHQSSRIIINSNKFNTNNNVRYCNNCTKAGHIFQKCTDPINSFGIIAFIVHNDEYKFLMIRRKDSFGYTDFVRGKYGKDDILKIRSIIDEMSIDEKKYLIDFLEKLEKLEVSESSISTDDTSSTTTTTTYSSNKSFSSIIQYSDARRYQNNKPDIKTISDNKIKEFFAEMWKKKWGTPDDTNKQIYDKCGNIYTSVMDDKQFKDEEISSLKKFQNIINGYNSEGITLLELLKESVTTWTETEWEFPKGRRSHPFETTKDCALREFIEETGIPESDIILINNVLPYEESFIGTNKKQYKYEYYLAYLNIKEISNKNDISESLLTNFQKNEVSGIAFMTYDECLKSIRPYCTEKKDVITKVYNALCKHNGIFLEKTIVTNQSFELNDLTNENKIIVYHNPSISTTNTNTNNESIDVHEVNLCSLNKEILISPEHDKNIICNEMTEMLKNQIYNNNEPFDTLDDELTNSLKQSFDNLEDEMEKILKYDIYDTVNMNILDNTNK